MNRDLVEGGQGGGRGTVHPSLSPLGTRDKEVGTLMKDL